MKSINQSDKIVMYVSNFPKVSETFILNKFLKLLESGYNVFILTDKISKENWKYFSKSTRALKIRRRIITNWKSNSKLKAVFIYPFIILNLILKSPVLLFQYFKIFKLNNNSLKQLYLDLKLLELNPKILHIEFGSLAEKYLHLKKLIDTKFVVSFRGYDLNYVGLDVSNYYQKTWENADQIHFLGNDLLIRARKRGYEQENYFLNPPSIDTQHFKSSFTTKNTKDSTLINLLSIGRLEWKKGYEYALQSVQLLKEKGFKLRYKIIGDGNYYEAITFAIAQMSLGNEVHLLGSCSSETIKKQLEWADIFLHTAVSEGFCNAVLEAQSMQVPVVCTDSDGLSENIISNKTGILVPRRNSKLIAESIEKIINSPELGKEMGKQGRENVIANFTLDKQIKVFGNVYDQLLNNT